MLIKLKKTNFHTVKTITDNRICCGCGACSVVCPASAINFIFGQRFNFPEIDQNKCILCKKCLDVCCGSFLLKGTKPDIKYAIAPVDANAFLIHSKDTDIRNDAASGGFITGLLIYLLENKKIDGCIVVRCEGNDPLIAQSFIATSKQEIISACGSKYAPVSSLISLQDIIKKPGRCAFVGTPCMLEGLTKLEKYFPELREKIALKIGFVCAGMASRLSTKNYIEQEGHIDLSKVRKICYRGGGWPGRFRVFGENKELIMDRPLIGGSLTHVVGVDHYLRCENCLDHFAHFADIVVSDPWTEEMIKSEKQGRSAILIKTASARNAVLPAISAGYFAADEISVEDMISFNKHLFVTKNHQRHSWMFLYQLLFMYRLQYLLPLLKLTARGKLCGVITTLKAKLTKYYY
jgi:coenzyme F420 hydrogenase subunit beta